MSAPDSLGEWLDSALGDVPADLSLRLVGALPEGWREVAVADAADVVMGAAVNELRILLAQGCETRWAAPRLLAVDALITHACELVALAGKDMDKSSERMTEQIVSAINSAGESS